MAICAKNGCRTRVAAGKGSNFSGNWLERAAQWVRLEKIDEFDRHWENANIPKHLMALFFVIIIMSGLEPIHGLGIRSQWKKLEIEYFNAIRPDRS